jgi:hypothetical protein
MDNFFNYTCKKCKGEDEAKFCIAGPHVKQVCLHCGTYVKFIDKSLMPSVVDIKHAIWVWSGNDLEIINKAKEKTGFIEPENNYTLSAKLTWWNVYLKVRSLAPSF